MNYLVPRWGAFALSYFEIDGFESEFTDWLLDLEKVPRKVTREHGRRAPRSSFKLT